MQKPRRRGAAWSGVSSQKQAEAISPQEQMRLCHEHAAKWGIEIVAELEVAESRSIILLEDAARRIPAYAELRRLIKEKAIDVLFCYDVGRLGRKTPLILAIIELCDESGILVYEIESPPRALDETYDYSARIVHAIEATGYQHEVDKLKERLAYGRMGRVQAGNMPSGRPPYGYTVVVRLRRSQTVRTIEVDESRAAIVREIFSRYLDGEGFGTIGFALNARGVPSPSGIRWHHRLVADVIKRAWRYAGYGEITVTTRHGRQYVKAQGNWTPIIDATTAERAIAERATRKANRRVADTKSRLSGLVWCDRCKILMNQSLPAIESNGRPRHVRFYCKNPNHANAVPTRRILDAIAIAIEDLLASDLSAIEDAPSAALDAIHAQIAEHETAIKRRQASITQAQTYAIDGLLSADDLRAQLDRLNAAVATEQTIIQRLRSQLDAEQARGTQRERLAHIAEQGRAMLTTDNVPAANAWLREYVSVWCDNNRIVEVRLG
jgi:DNA invertase Pin-like site-specific DNA recombinase